MVLEEKVISLHTLCKMNKENLLYLTQHKLC